MSVYNVILRIIKKDMAFLILCLITMPAYSDNDNKWLVVTEYLPPLQDVDEQGRVIGNMTAVVKAILDAAELKAEIVVLPWARAEHMAKTRPNTLIYSISRTQQREDLFYWVTGIGLTDTGLFKLRSNNDIQLHSIEDIHKELIGIKRGDVAANYLSTILPASNLQVSTSTIDTVKMLLSQRIDLLPANEEQLRHYCLELGCNVEQFEKVLHLQALEEVIYLAANRDSDPVVLSRLTEVAAKRALTLEKQ